MAGMGAAIRIEVILVLAVSTTAGWSCQSDAGRGRTVPSSGVDRVEIAPNPPPTESRSECLPVQPARVWLDGILRQEERLGPPGYGENPSQDEKDTILVLYLRHPVSVCADPTPGARHPAVDSVKAIQLAGRIGGLSSQLDEQIGVYGNLFHADFGRQFTDVLMEVERVRLRDDPSRARHRT
jgi:hypothetical protein